MRTKLQISAELTEKWAEAAEAGVEAETLLYWKARDALDRGDLETAEFLLSAMRYAGVQPRIMSSLMLNEARIAKKIGEAL